MTRFTIGMLWDEEVDMNGEMPFQTEALNHDAIALTQRVRRRDMELFVAPIDQYEIERLSKAWHWDNGWTIENDIDLDAAIDRFPYNEETIDLKKAIDTELGTINSFAFKTFCRDKYKTYKRFPGLIPETQKADPETVSRFLDTHQKAVIKPRYGAAGRGVSIIETAEAYDHADNLLVQQYIEPGTVEQFGIEGPHDLRIVMVAGEPRASYIRTNDEGTLANINKGGGDLIYVEKDEIPDSILQKLRTINKNLEQYQPALYTADFLFGANGGVWLVELNTKPPLGYHRDIQQREKEQRIIEGAIDLLKHDARG